jgi:hypothetical protein
MDDLLTLWNRLKYAALEHWSGPFPLPRFGLHSQFQTANHNGCHIASPSRSSSGSRRIECSRLFFILLLLFRLLINAHSSHLAVFTTITVIPITTIVAIITEPTITTLTTTATDRRHSEINVSQLSKVQENILRITAIGVFLEQFHMTIIH